MRQRVIEQNSATPTKFHFEVIETTFTDGYREVSQSERKLSLPYKFQKKGSQFERNFPPPEKRFREQISSFEKNCPFETGGRNSREHESPSRRHRFLRVSPHLKHATRGEKLHGKNFTQ